MKLYFLSFALFSLADAFSTKPLSPKEILAQQREKSGLPDPDKHPKLYSDELLDDMKDVLLLLEKRVQGGQGSISSAEVDNFVTMSNNILVEMKEKEYQRLEDASSPAPAPAPASPPAATAVATEASTATEVSAAAATPVVENSAPSSLESTEEASEEYDAELEGPGYSPAGGQGSIPKDTTNTYIIPGMDAMSPEEYQAALQKSIIDRQAKRKETGLYGNRNTWDYLNNLSGDTGVLKKDPLEDN